MSLPLPASSAAPTLHCAVRLADWGVIRAAGAEAHKFLQGQLTQDVDVLRDDRAALAGYCTAKGRLLASFVMWQRGPEEVLLACSADLLATTLKRLQMFVLRAKCKLSDASADVPLWGVAGAPTTATVWARGMQDEADVIRLPDAVVDGAAVTRQLVAGSEPALPALDANTWRWLEVLAAVPRVQAATVEQFVPQMVNLEVVGGVSFRKGCYPGQEIVARSQYRGTLKRRAYVMSADESLQVGQEVFHSGDPEQPAGLVALAGSSGARHVALVELKIATLADGSLHAGSATGPLLTPQPLPYAFPAEAA